MPTRLVHAIKYASMHFGISLLIALLAASLVFLLLYPAPYRQMLNVSGIYLLLIAIDVTCGPLLTLLVASPKKTKLATGVDFSVIGLVQLAALLYGLHSLYAARPAMVVFETDRLVLVQASQIRYDKYPSTLPQFQKAPLAGVDYAQVSQTDDGQTMLKRIELELSGLPPNAMPASWREYDQQTRQDIQKRQKPLADLIKARPQAKALLEAQMQKLKKPVDELFFIPFVSSKTYDWVAILDKNAHILSYAPVEGFIR